MRLSFVQAAIIPITEPRSRCADRKLRGQTDPSLATTSGWQLSVSQPRTAEVARR